MNKHIDNIDELYDLLGLEPGSLKKENEIFYTATSDGAAMEIKIQQEENGLTITSVYSDGIECDFCNWCKELYPVADMYVEKDFGYLCFRCVKAIQSRGEELDFDDDEN